MDRSVSAVNAPSSIWHNRGFLRLWIAQMISNAGTQIANVALPLTAILVLGATPTQIGLLGIASYLPNLLFGLLAGVWVYRARRRPILVGADIGRALLLGSIPVAALLGHLTFLHLYIVAFAAGILTLFFTIASLAVLPSLVARHRLVEANSKLAISDSVLMIAGPGAAGGLIQLTSAPKAIIADAVSYLLSGLSLGSIGASEPAPRTSHERPSIWREIGECVRALLGTPLLRALATSSCVGFCALAMQNTVLLLFLVRQLGLTPTVIGFVLACNGIGSLLGAGGAGWTAHRIGTGPAVVLGTLLWAIGSAVVPLAGLTHITLPFIGIGQGLAGSGAGDSPVPAASSCSAPHRWERRLAACSARRSGCARHYSSARSDSVRHFCSLSSRLCGGCVTYPP